MTPKKYFHQKCDKKKKYQDIQNKLFLAQNFLQFKNPKAILTHTRIQMEF
jgi:hypothetical protein